MSKILKEIPVIFTVDDAYIPFLAVSLKSLIDNSSLKNKYEIKILYTNLSNENKMKIKKYEQTNINIEFVNVSDKLEQIKDKLYTRNYYSNATYYRLFLPELYKQYDKVIYLDSDTIILDDIAKLYKTKLTNELVAAVPDGAVQTVKIFQDYVEKVIGMIDYNYYFNAGVLVLNLEELRKYKFEDKFIYLLNKVKYEVAQDQDYLNRLCKGKVKLLDSSWNKMPITVGRVEEENIKIIHFNLGFKPWHLDNIPYEEKFWKYAKKTEFYNEIMEIKNNYTEEEKMNDDVKSTKLFELAQKEADCVGDDRISKTLIKKGLRRRKWILKNKQNEKKMYRQQILDKIQELEREGKFDIDVEEDPPTIVLTPDNIDYLRTTIKSKIKRIFANEVGERFLDNLLKNNKLIIKTNYKKSIDI